MKNHPIINKIEQEQMEGKEIPNFSPGDTISVSMKVIEGSRERMQVFQGVLIAKKNRGINSAFILRKLSNGVFVERTFQTYSPLIADIQIKRRGLVRKAKLYYMRGLTGKAARIKEKIPSRA